MQILDRALFNPRVNNTLAALDDPKSMFSIAARDAVDSTGRTVSEYKRDPHGGRERLIEEVLTFAIWGFGVRTMKQLYDAAILHTPGLKEKLPLPDLDLSLLPKGKAEETQKNAQVLTRDVLEKFTKKYGNTVTQYNALSELVQDTGAKHLQRQNLYRYSSLAKFGIATMVPALIIALGIPTFNQWLTRKMLAKQPPKTPLAKPFSSARAGYHQPKPFRPTGTTVAPLPMAFRPMMGSARPQPMGYTPIGPAAMAAGTTGGYGNPFHYNRPAAPPAWNPMATNQPTQGFGGLSPFSASPAPGQAPGSPWAALGAQGQFSGGATSHSPNAVRFGGGMASLSNAASEILQHERWTTLCLDGTISSGRIYKARNTTERLEIVFREAAIISFLYWMQRPIQDAIGKFIGKFSGIPSELEFKTIQFLHKNPQQYAQGFKQTLEEAVTDLGLNAEKTAGDPHAQLVGKIHDYFLHKRGVPGIPQNVLLEAAIDAGWIPTFKQASSEQKTMSAVLKGVLHDINPVKAQQLTDNTYLDLTKKIDTHAIFSLKDHMARLAGKSIETDMKPLLTQVMRLRGGAWLLSNAICFGVLSGLIPWVQHEITRRSTGKNYFPGVQPS